MFTMKTMMISKTWSVQNPKKSCKNPHRRRRPEILFSVILKESFKESSVMMKTLTSCQKNRRSSSKNPARGKKKNKTWCRWLKRWKRIKCNYNRCNNYNRCSNCNRCSNYNRCNNYNRCSNHANRSNNLKNPFDVKSTNKLYNNLKCRHQTTALHNCLQHDHRHKCHRRRIQIFL